MEALTAIDTVLEVQVALVDAHVEMFVTLLLSLVG